MSPLPCRCELKAVGVVGADGYLSLAGLRKHLHECRPCASLYRVMAKAMGSRGGLAGRGAAKRRGSTEHYRRLAELSWKASQ